MKRFLMSTAAAGMALSLIGAPLAMAQQGPPHPPGNAETHAPAHVQNNAPAHAENNAPAHVQNNAPVHAESHAQAPQHVAVQHNNQHVATQHETQHSNMSHPQERTTHEENHAAPPQHQAFSGGHQWHSGDHYTGGRTYVSNYSHYHLHAPPAGYQWVQDGGQFVLIAVASGIIANVILNSSYQ